MNPVAANIIESLVGNWCLVDCETTSLEPATGALISVGFLPFTITQNYEQGGKPEFNISTQHKPAELWFFNAELVGQLSVAYDEGTMQWHRNKNPAFAHYHDLYIETAEANLNNAGDYFSAMFKNDNYNFISRHAFDANWLKEHWLSVFESIHYRNFYDISSMLRGMGFQNEKLYRQIQGEAKRDAMSMQAGGLFPGVPKSSLYVEHRPFTDTLIDFNILKRATDFIYYAGREAGA